MSAGATEDDLAEILGILEQHQNRLRDLEHHQASTPASPPGPEQAAQEERDTRFEWWVEWLDATYGLEVELKGWIDCDAIRHELLALFRWYEAAMADDAHPADGVHWHDALARCVDRFSEHRGRQRQSRDRPALRVAEHQSWPDWLTQQRQVRGTQG